MTKKSKPRKHSPPAGALDAHLRRIADIIDKHGWAVQTVLSNPPYAYTVGLSATLGLPELVIMGIAPSSVNSILNDAAHRMKAGELVLAEGIDFDKVFDDFSARMVQLKPAEVAMHLRVAMALTPPGGQLPTAWQIIWPDPEGRFPGHPDANPGYAAMQNLAMTRTGGDAH